MREESERKQGRGLCEACWIIIRMWDLLWVESYWQSLSLGITWPAYVPTWSLWQLVENRVNGRKEGAHCNNPDQRWGWPGPRWYPKRWWEVAKFQKFWKYRIWGKERSQGQLQGLGVFLTFLSIIQKEHNLKIKTSPSPKDPGSLTPASIHSLTHLHTYPSALYLSIYPSTHLSITKDID